MDFRRFVTNRNPGAVARVGRLFLRLLSIPYAIAAESKNAAYAIGIKKAFRSTLPTISVGNLSVGGTGKSPAVAWLAAWLRTMDVRVAILSRGYGALDSGQNDEALELEMRLPDVPHLQHWDRVASAKLAEEELDMQALVLDDGFQHRRIGRDFEIVLIDATDPPAALWPLPGGLLREPFGNLSRADVVLLTRSDQADQGQLQWIRSRVERYVTQTNVFLAQHRPSHLQSTTEPRTELTSLRGRRVLAFCGIGNPESFFQTLRSCGAEIVDTRVWPDHHGYDHADVEELDRWSAEHQDIDEVVCTAKDWVKLQCDVIGGRPLKSLMVEMSLDRAEDLQAKILAVLQAKTVQGVD